MPTPTLCLPQSPAQLQNTQTDSKQSVKWLKMSSAEAAACRDEGDQEAGMKHQGACSDTSETCQASGKQQQGDSKLYFLHTSQCKGGNQQYLGLVPAQGSPALAAVHSSAVSKGKAWDQSWNHQQRDTTCFLLRTGRSSGMLLESSPGQEKLQLRKRDPTKTHEHP